MSLPHDGNKYELIDQKLYMSPTGFEQEDIATEIAMRLRAFAQEHRLGAVVGSSMGCRMKSGDVLSPDVAFISRERLSGMKRAPKGFFDGAPDLVVEVLSPNDDHHKVEKKLTSYFGNGSRLAWVIVPEERRVFVYRDSVSKNVLSEGDELAGEDVLPGFTLPVQVLFRGFDF